MNLISIDTGVPVTLDGFNDEKSLKLLSNFSARNVIIHQLKTKSPKIT